MVMIGTPTFLELDDDFSHKQTISSTGRKSIEWTCSYNVYVDTDNTLDDVIGWANLNLPTTFDGKPRRSFELEEDGLINPGEYKFTLTFKTPDDKDEDEEYEINPYVTVDCVQGRSKLKYSYDTVKDFQHTEAVKPYNFKNAINVSDNGIEGAEIASPSFTWAETWTLPKTIATLSYLYTVGELRGKTNIAPFRGRPAETVLFLGIRARNKNKDNVEVVFNFSYAAHEAIDSSQFPNFPDMAGEIKKGHDYIWSHNQSKKVLQRTVKQPVYIAIEKVYKSINFDVLQIGTDLPATANILP